jgi:putative ABC transport system ATP-binding protein
MNLIGLLDIPTRGSYFLENQEVDQMSIDKLAKIRNQKIGFIFQSFHLLPRTSAMENVELPLVYSDRSDFSTLARNTLKAVGLEDRIHHYPNELSGGEQQRVAIARALVNDPDILLADEPTGNLDTRSGLEVLQILQDLHQEGKTIVLITHDQNLAEHSRRIIRIVDGKITSDTPVEKPREAAEELSKLPQNEEEQKESTKGEIQ